MLEPPSFIHYDTRWLEVLCLSFSCSHSQISFQTEPTEAWSCIPNHELLSAQKKKGWRGEKNIAWQWATPQVRQRTGHRWPDLRKAPTSESGRLVLGSAPSDSAQAEYMCILTHTIQNISYGIKLKIPCHKNFTSGRFYIEFPWSKQNLPDQAHFLNWPKIAVLYD